MPAVKLIRVWKIRINPVFMRIPDGGSGGIRTHGARKSSTDFEKCTKAKNAIFLFVSFCGMKAESQS